VAGSDVPYHGIGLQLFVLAFNLLNLEDKKYEKVIWMDLAT
jgi:hypothetical protein